jgi:hypothetical protein
MAIPKWFISAGDDAFSLINKKFNQADPAIDAMMRVVAKRAKSAPGQKFYDPEQDVIERLPATAWKEGIERLRSIRTASDKDADVVLPWKWEGGRPGEATGGGYERAGRYQLTSWLEGIDKAAKRRREPKTKALVPPKRYPVAFKQFVKEFKETRGTSSVYARKILGDIALRGFRSFELEDTPREFTGEAGLSALTRARKVADEMFERAPLNFSGSAEYYPRALRTAYQQVREAIQANKEKLAGMSNRERNMFFELLGDWDDDPETLADVAIALAG